MRGDEAGGDSPVGGGQDLGQEHGGGDAEAGGRLLANDGVDRAGGGQAGGLALELAKGVEACTEQTPHASASLFKTRSDHDRVHLVYSQLTGMRSSAVRRDGKDVTVAPFS